MTIKHPAVLRRKPEMGGFSLPNPPVVSSGNAGWDKLQLELQRQPAYYLPEHCSSCHVICVNTGGTVTLDRTVDGRSQTVDALPVGNVGIYPAHLRRNFQWYQDAEFIHLFLDPTVLAQASAELCSRQGVVLEPQLNAECDPLIHQLALALKTSLENGGMGGKLYVDAMTNALAMHLLSRYALCGAVTPDRPEKLPKQRLKDVLDYIHVHFDQDISLSALAGIACLSEFHFARLFKRATGYAPHQYHIRCRVERAKHLLSDGRQGIAEVAYAVGFSSQSHFYRHFKRHAGATPKAFLRGQ